MMPRPLYPRILKQFKWLIKPLFKFTAKLYLHYKKTLTDASYCQWAQSRENMCFVKNKLTTQPYFSIVVATFNTPRNHLLEMVYSVVNQHYSNWELILINASSDEEYKQQVLECKEIDTRIRVIDIQKNIGIAGNTNIGINHASGDFIAFLDHDDLLHPCALHSVAYVIDSHSYDIVYTDEDKVSDQGNWYFAPFFKPSWSPDLLRNVNYFNHLTVIRKKLIKDVNGLRGEFNGAQDYDLLLRIIDKSRPSIGHVPQVLYHWRAAKTSTASDISNKSNVLKVGEQAVTEHLKRNKVQATARAILGRPGFYEVLYDPVEYAIVIGPVDIDNRSGCALWLQELLDYDDGLIREIVIGSWYENFMPKNKNKIKRIHLIEENENFWSDSAKKIRSNSVLVFKIACTPIDENSLSKLAAATMDKDHDAVSPIIIDKNGAIIDAGLVTESSNHKRILFQGSFISDNTYYGSTEFVRNVDDISTNVVAYKSDYFQKLMGLKQTNYSMACRYSDLISNNEKAKNKLVLWSHSVLFYRGVLNSLVENDARYNPRLSSLTTKVTVAMDNWEEGHEHEAW